MSENTEKFKPTGIGAGGYIGDMLIGAILGAVAGPVLRLCIMLISCVCNIVSCSWNGKVAVSEGSWIPWLAIGAVVGLILGMLYALFKDSEERNKSRVAEEERRRLEAEEAERRRKAAEAAALRKKQAEERRNYEAKEKRFKSWQGSVNTYASATLSAFENNDTDKAGKALESLWKQGEEGRKADSRESSSRYNSFYDRQYNNLGKDITKRMQTAVRDSLVNGRVSISNLKQVETGLSLMLAYRSKDCRESLTDQAASKILDALEHVRSGIATAKKTTCILNFEDYGHVVFNGEDPRKLADSTIGTMMRELDKRRDAALTKMETDYCLAAISLDENFFDLSARLMWFFADKTPFDVARFDDARKAYNAFTADMTTDKKGHSVTIGTVEEILARLYAKSKVGGSSTAKQEEDYVNAWLAYKISNNDRKSCFAFASGLAWLELYETEKWVLRKLVEERVQLTAELQERLGFLESGNTRNVKLYNIEKTGDFAYDSSAVDWKNSDFSTFFRKLAMKKVELNYSLAIEKWTKSLPLRSGQTVSQDAIYAEFQEMVNDFDGEVVCGKKNAYAIDLANVRYDGAVLFGFTSERSRCITVLFSCEKYGRNLNITMITLFTPEPGLSPADLERYAIAVKGNNYMSSFRESVLQSLDAVLKVERSIYGDTPDADDDTLRSKRNIIE